MLHLLYLPPLDDEEYSNFDEIGFYTIVDGELERVYQSDKELPMVWLQYDSNGEKFRYINGKPDEKFTEILLNIDSNVFDKEQGDV